MMKYREFGTTGLLTSEISFGGGALSGEGKGYSFGEMPEEAGIELISYAYSQGINLFDTAPIYGFNRSEKILGLALKDIRDKVYISNKSGVTWHETKRVNMTNDAESTQSMIENSLKNLNTDYIDLYMIHYPDPRVDIRFPMEVLAKAKLEGKIKHIGLCNTTVEDLKKANEVASIEFIQGEHNLFNHTSVELLNKDYKNLGFMGWGGFDKGILTGRVHEGRVYDSCDARSWAPWFKKQDFKTKYKKVNALKEICDQHKISLLDFIIQYNLSSNLVSTMITGFKSKGDLDQILDSLNKTISKDILMKGEEIFDSSH